MTLRRVLRDGVDLALAGTGILARLERRAVDSCAVLMYHRVLDDPEQVAAYPLDSLVVPASEFRRQVAWLSEHCEIARFDRCKPGKQRTDRPVVVLTFDDGYWDNAAIAAPILEEYGVCATFFVTSGFVDGSIPVLWFDRAALGWRHDEARCKAVAEASTGERPTSLGAWMALLKRCDAAERESILGELAPLDGGLARECRGMSREELRRLHEAGHEIAGHTHSHPILPRCDDGSLREELERGKAVLETVLGAPVATMAYPNGDHDERVREAAAAAGYVRACVTAGGRWCAGTDPFEVPRVMMHPSRLVDRRGRFSARGLRCELVQARESLRRNGRHG